MKPSFFLNIGNAIADRCYLNMNSAAYSQPDNNDHKMAASVCLGV